MAFSVVLNINSVNLTSKLVASVPVRVRVSEGEARIATFTLNPDAGTIDPYDWIGQAVTIDYVDGSTTRIFTGIVHQPTYDVYTGLTAFICTDNLQEVVELISRSAIDALITQGKWDETVFNDPEENWTYTQQRMSTYPGSFDLSPAGSARVTSWTAKVSADYTYTDSTIVDQSLSLSLAERRSITNSVDITFSSRFERLWQRELAVTWQVPSLNWYTWLGHSYELPTKENIVRALSGWQLKEITYTDLPISGYYNSSGTWSATFDAGEIGWLLNDYGRAQARGFDATIATRFKQNVTCNYVMNVKSPASVTQHTELKITRNHASSSPSDETFTQFDSYQAPTGIEVESGNWIDTNEIDISNALLTALNQAKTTILSTHRMNRVSFDCVLNPNADVDKTIRVNHSKLQAKGKVSSVDHEIDFLNGRAISTIEIAVYLPNVGGQSSTTIAVPATPYADPSGLPSSVGTLSTYLGNDDGVPVEDPDWRGWIGNYYNWSGFGPVPEKYETKLQIEIPAVEGTDVSAVEFSTSMQTFNVAIPQDELVIIK